MKRTLLFTGASGFLGKNICPILKKNFNITTVGLTSEDDYNVDIAKKIPDFKNEIFDVILHAAGKAHVIPKTREEEQSFFDINYQGTVNLCRGFELSGAFPKSFIFISTVAVYGCESGKEITEDYPLNGVTPYALSKIQAEKYLTEWCLKHNVILSILRPSLIAGPNPPGNLGSMINGIKFRRYFSIGKGKARKSILMVDDIASLIPKLIEKGGTYNICDTDHPSFLLLEHLIASQLGEKNPISIPYWLGRLLAILGDLLGDKAPINTEKFNKITTDLTFSNKKAREFLNWEPLKVIDNFKIK